MSTYYHPLPSPTETAAPASITKSKKEVSQMSFTNDPGFIAFKNSHKHVALPIGTVFVLSYSEPLPPVGRKLTKAEGLQYKEQLKTILEQWSIVSFDQGAINGSGYGYEIKDHVGSECGQGFIVIPGQFQ